MKKKICKSCGAEAEHDAKFCSKCGEIFQDETVNGASSDASESEGQNSYEYTKDTTQNQNSSFTNTSADTNSAFDNYQQASGQKDQAKKGDIADVESVKAILIIGYIIPVLFFLPLVSNPKSEFGRYHANQILLTFIAYAAISVLGAITCGFGAVLTIFGLVLQILGIVNVCNGEMKPLPLIGGIELIK
jgi:uncharacterized membrane protein